MLSENVKYIINCIRVSPYLEIPERNIIIPRDILTSNGHSSKRLLQLGSQRTR